ncbi:autotransporter domain-containing protein [Pelagibacterium halotolerans]|uniref:autotransporter domain-containing protein n=1 Tax=Pelagibacterium halotolerans TaxID=531813 RepID=UPI00384E5F99
MGNPAASGIVSVSGANSTWTMSEFLVVGEVGNGNLTISADGTVSNTFATIAANAGSTGTATVGGGGSWSNSSTLTVGASGDGTLDVNSFGSVTSNGGNIGANTNAAGTVNISGSNAKWSSAGDVNVGVGGVGTLTVSGVGEIELTSGTLNVALQSGSTGTLNIGAAAGEAAAVAGIVDAATIEFGAGTGKIVFNHTGGAYDFDSLISGNGAVELHAGTTRFDANNTYTGGTSIQNGATLQLGVNEALADSASVTVASGGQFDLNDFTETIGTLDGAGDVALGVGQLTVGSGTFSGAISGTGTFAKNGNGTLTLAGDSSGFGGTSEVSNGNLIVNGTLGGALNVTGGTLSGTGTIGGSVSVGNGTVAAGNSPGTLTIGGDFTLANGSSLDFELGDPSGTAGVDSDLINVGGDLTLDGTLNVTDAGGFGSGLYRLINYGGTLTDNGLDMGTAPGGYSYDVQTATAGQVNLLVDPTALTFWNGTTTSADGTIHGGDGIWTATDTNWTDANGAQSAAYDPDGFLVFAGTAGEVTVDGAGVSTSAGMQFAVDGYSISGGDIALTGATSFRVGDGTSAGADYVATIGSALTGTGSLTKTDLGTLRLTGTNSYTGGTTVSAGTLVGNITSLQGNIANNAALVFDQEADGTYTGILSGTGTTTKSGIGTLTLMGDNSGFTGTTEVVDGSLIVDGILGGTINAAGGSIGGSGTLGNIVLASGGNLTPGNSIGTMNVANATFASGSVFEVELNDDGNVAGTNNDLLNATGTLTINGGTVRVTPENGSDDGTTYTAGTVYTVATAAGGVTGTFDTLTDNYAFLSFALSYDANNVFITSALGGLCLDEFTANQCATADSIEALGSGALFTAVTNLSNTEAAGAMDQLSGEVHASAKTVLLEDSRFAREAALDRLRHALGGTGTNVGQATHESTEGTTLWARGFGSWSRWNGDGNAAAVSRNTGGLFLGGDAQVFGDVYLGLMAGYGRSGMNVDDRASSVTVDSYTLGAYAGGDWDGFSLKGGVAHSWHSLDTSRAVDFTGFSDSLTASYNARTFQAYTEAAYGFAVGSATLEPFANLAFVNLNSDGYTENGGAAALTAAGQTVNATFTTLGIRGETQVELGGMDATLSGGLGWRHAFGDAPTATQSFASGGDAFTIAGVPLGRNALVLDAGLAVDLTDSASFGLSYGGQLGAGISDHGAKASLSVSF